MLPHAYKINNLNIVLTLGESARHTLLELLEQFDGELCGCYDRSQMNAAQKQKAKRGIAELKEVGIVSKPQGHSNRFCINPDVIQIKKQAISIQERIASNPDIKTVGSQDVVLMEALETFFYEFFNTPFEFKVKGRKQLLLPCDRFKKIVDLTNHATKNFPFHNFITTHLLIYQKILGMLYFNTNERQKFLAPYPMNELIYRFNQSFDPEFWKHRYPVHCSYEIKHLTKFAESWFESKYPELSI